MRIQPPKREHKLHHRPTTASRGPAHTCGTPLGADIRVVAGTPAASRPAGSPVALRAPSDPAEVSLSINVLMHVPPPPSTLIFKGPSVSRMLVHRSDDRVVGSLKTPLPGQRVNGSTWSTWAHVTVVAMRIYGWCGAVTLRLLWPQGENSHAQPGGPRKS